MNDLFHMLLELPLLSALFIVFLRRQSAGPAFRLKHSPELTAFAYFNGLYISIVYHKMSIQRFYYAIIYVPVFVLVIIADY